MVGFGGSDSFRSVTINVKKKENNYPSALFGDFLQPLSGPSVSILGSCSRVLQGSSEKQTQ